MEQVLERERCGKPRGQARGVSGCTAQHGDLVSRLSRTLAAANHYLVRLLAKYGMGELVPSHGDILMQLFAHDSLTMAALADSIGRDPSTVTTLVKKLVAQGYVSTEKDMRDRRVTHVRLTDAGRSLGSRIACVNEELQDVMTRGLDDDELAQTARVLRTMKENFEKASEK